MIKPRPLTRADFPSDLAHFMWRCGLSGEDVARITNLDKATISRAKNGAEVSLASEQTIAKMIAGKL